MKGLMLGLVCLSLLGAEKEPALPCDYFKSLVRFRLPETGVSTLLQFPLQTFDEKNGYCALEMDHGGMGYFFAQFNAATGKVFAFSEPSLRDPNGYDTTFWSYRQGLWVEKKDVAPPIGLEDFWDSHLKTPQELVPYAFFELQLPRNGSVIKVRLKGLCVDKQCENANRVEREASYNQIELLWNARTGRFSKGTKTLVR